jgi:chromosome segregation ATPase
MTGLADVALALDLPAGANIQDPASRPEPPRDRRWPTGVTQEPDATFVNVALARPLCSWGDPPKTWWQTPFYALLVYQGHRNLLGELKPTTDELRQVEVKRDQCLMALAMQLRSTLASHPAFATALAALQAADSECSCAQAQLQQLQTQSTSEIQAVERAIATTETHLTDLQAALRAAQQALDSAEIDLQRKQARIQRLGIERRNIEQVPGNDPNKARHLDELSEQATALLPAADACHVSVQSRRVELTQAEAMVGQKQSEMTNLKLRRTALERGLNSSVTGASTAMTQACEQRAAVLADLGRAILQTKGQVPVADATLDKLVHYDDAVIALCQRKRLCLAALESYDRRAVKRGLQVTALVVVLLVIACLRRALG